MPAKDLHPGLFEGKFKPSPRIVQITPYFERKTRPLCGRVACNASRTFRQVLFSGISRSLPFFVFSNLTRFRISDSWDHSRLNCSLFRMPVFSATSNSGMCFENLLFIASRSRFSSFSDRNRMRALFSALCSTSRAGLLVTLPSASAILYVFPKTFLYRFLVAGD